MEERKKALCDSSFSPEDSETDSVLPKIQRIAFAIVLRFHDDSRKVTIVQLQIGIGSTESVKDDLMHLAIPSGAPLIRALPVVFYNSLMDDIVEQSSPC